MLDDFRDTWHVRQISLFFKSGFLSLPFLKWALSLLESLQLLHSSLMGVPNDAQVSWATYWSEGEVCYHVTHFSTTEGGLLSKNCILGKEDGGSWKTYRRGKNTDEKTTKKLKIFKGRSTMDGVWANYFIMPGN